MPWYGDDTQTLSIDGQALQSRLPSNVRLNDAGDSNYQVQYQRGNVWQPVAELPKKIEGVSAAYPFDPQAVTYATLANYLKKQAQEWNRTVPTYYEYQASAPAQQSSGQNFYNLYGFNQQPAQLSGGQQAYMPVWQQASWMPAQDRQAYIQQRAEALQKALGGPGIAPVESANLSVLAQLAQQQRQAQANAVADLVRNALGGAQSYMAAAQQMRDLGQQGYGQLTDDERRALLNALQWRMGA